MIELQSIGPSSFTLHLDFLSTWADKTEARTDDRHSLVLKERVAKAQLLVVEDHQPQSTASHIGPQTFVTNIHGIRYQVKDVVRSVASYTQHLGFKLRASATPGLCECLGDQWANPSQWSRRVRIPADAEW